MDEESVLTARQAAQYVRVSEAALRLWRADGRGPRYFKAGAKLIRYRRRDLDSWIEARLCQEFIGSHICKTASAT